ncbi:hypothetical protein FVEG_15536 [Fusarium verticillioides 7600]|uniref:Gfd2/YDR514C-like C-terminal domain-containing protein n=1 Tax=Gibberella moniliformis (strain M3125 / FGSC 7600) TaxID=334819 RepID=W7MEI5_GIBM7|nr:hypothetical protein FVEG_15536 [Fusarium verticillioides 7600]EWG43187.1 hypothetical protein FVEG_15536 [Fusarium verticillioides 7600]
MIEILLKDAKPYPPPGDRASNLFYKMHPSHYIINEFRGHFGGNCGAWHTTEPYSFVFGPSQYINSDQLAPTLESLLTNLLKSRERTAYEKANKIDRNIVFLTWDPTLELDTLARLGLDWFSRPNIQLFDLQKHHMFAKQHGCHKVMDAIGLRYRDNRLLRAGDRRKGGHDVLHNGANDTVFQIQILLALQYMDPQLKPKVYDRVNFGQPPMTPVTTWLDFTWRGSVLDTLNVPLVDLRTVPGETKDHQLRARTDARMNDNNVPQAPPQPKPGRNKRMR